MALEYVFAPDTSNETRLDASQIKSQNPVKTHTGLADLRASIVFTGGVSFSDITGHAKRQDRLNIQWNNETKWTGYVTGIDANRGTGDARLHAKGIGKRLQETRPDYDALGGPVQYQNITVEDALRDYWPRTPFNSWNVTDAQTEQVASGQVLQSADSTSDWQSISSIPAETPLEARNNNIELLQSAVVKEGETPDSGTIFGVSGSDYSGGDAGELQSVPSSATWDVSFDYDLPAEYVGLAVRYRNRDDGSPVSGVTFEFNGETVDRLDDTGLLLLDWKDMTSSGAIDPSYDGYTGADLNAGETYPFTVSVESGGDASGLEIDVVCVYDTRYNYTFDNDNGGSSGYLDGPELYPSTVSTTLATEETSYNITSATVDSVWNDTSGGQAIALSNDNGATYTSTSNSQTATVDFSSAGRQAKVKLTFDRYGSRSTATPKQGYLGQQIQGDTTDPPDYTLRVDGNDRPVIVNLELSRNHFDNLKTLHEYGDFIWVIEHSDATIGNLVVESFKRGEVTRPSPSELSNPKNQQPAIQSGAYYNSIYLEGRKDETGSRPSAEVKNQSAISEDGREISPGVLRDLDVSTSAGAEFRARSLLNTAQSNNDLVGTVTCPPVMTDPGYTRAVSFDGGSAKEKTVEEVRLTQNPDSVEAVFDFVIRSGFSEDIAELRRNSREQGDQI